MNEENKIVNKKEATKGVIRQVDSEGVLIKETFFEIE